MSFRTECIKYNIISNNFTIFHNFTHGLYLWEIYVNLEYYEETDQVILSFLGFDDNANNFFKIYYCDVEGNCLDKTFSSFGDINLGDIYTRINLVIPLDKLSYHIFFYSSNTDEYLFDLDIKFELKCKNYFNYKKTWCLKNLPEGYFCNSSEDKTIDLCHENCLTRNSTPIEDNNNCLTCKETNKYFDLGNCRKNCTNGYFLHEEQKLICKCTNNIGCYFCEKNNKCFSCNTEEGFYQKIDEEKIDEFVNCYKDPEGYFLLNNKYYPCFSGCKNSSLQLNENDNKCIECKEGYEFKTDFEDDKNCYQKCEFNYYFDENKIYHCTANASCPSEYSKYIPEQKKCVQNDDIEIDSSSELNLISYIMNNNTEYNISGYLKNECEISTSIGDIIDKIRNSFIRNEIDDLMKDIKHNRSITKFLNASNLQFIYLDKQFENNINTNVSIIDLGKCENILKILYNIGNNSLLLYKIDTKIKGYNTFHVEYELYNPNNFSLLNLSLCNQSSINIHIPLDINPNEVYKYDPKGEFYNDMCFPHTDNNGADVILLDRKNGFINNNLSLCDDECDFIRYDEVNKRAICNCKIKYYIEKMTTMFEMNPDKFFYGWKNVESIMNLNVIKCVKLLKTKDGFLNNIGNFLLLSIIFIFIISAFNFYYKGFPKLKSEIIELKNDLIKNFNLKNNSDNNSNKKINETNDKELNIKKRKKKRKIKKKKKNNKIMESTKKLHTDIISENKYDKNLILIQNSKNIIDINENKLNSDSHKQENKGVLNINDYELNSLDYKDALKLDKRSYLQYYSSLIKAKQLLIFTFYYTKDYNSYIIKIELFLFAFALYLTVNALFLLKIQFIQYMKTKEFSILLIIFLKLFIQLLFLR